jgi:hypothetical protein
VSAPHVLELTHEEAKELHKILGDTLEALLDRHAETSPAGLLVGGVYDRLVLSINGPRVTDGRPFLRPTDEVELMIPGHGCSTWVTVSDATADGTTSRRIRACCTAIRRDGAEIWRTR